MSSAGVDIHKTEPLAGRACDGKGHDCSLQEVFAWLVLAMTQMQEVLFVGRSIYGLKGRGEKSCEAVEARTTRRVRKARNCREYIAAQALSGFRVPRTSIFG